MGTGIATRSGGAARPARETPSGPGTAESGHWPRKWGGSGSGVGGSSEEKQIIHGDVQVREESGAGHLDATGITSFPVDKKTRPHKAAGIVDIGMSLSVLLQFRVRIAVDKMKLSIEIPPFSPTFKGKQKNNRGGMAVEAGVTRAPARKPLFSPWVPGAEHSVITVQ